MTTLKIRLATRSSQLAICQAEQVSQLLQRYYSVAVQLIPIVSHGDRLLNQPLASSGGDKGWFVKTLEQALLDNKADIAVHSLKDMTVHIPEGLVLAAVLPRANPFDAFVSSTYSSLSALPQNARIGTISLRRHYQLKAFRPDIAVIPLRGNINSRLAKLQQAKLDGLILAYAGLERLKRTHRVRELLKPPHFLPAVGQGAIAIECRQADTKLKILLETLNHRETAICTQTERAIIRKLGGGCSMPVGVYAMLKDDDLQVRGQVGKVDGSHIITAQAQGLVEQSEDLAERVSLSLLNQGAKSLLNTGSD